MRFRMQPPRCRFDCEHLRRFYSCRVLFIVPVLWALVGSMAAMTLGLTQDLMLWLAGIAAVAAIGAPAPSAPRLGADAS